MINTGQIGARSPTLKWRILNLLESVGRNSLSMGLIISRLDLDKGQAAEVSSLLYGLRARGLVDCFEGPADSAMGPRTVRRYRWAGVTVAVKVKDGRRV